MKAYEITISRKRVLENVPDLPTDSSDEKIDLDALVTFIDENTEIVRSQQEHFLLIPLINGKIVGISVVAKGTTGSAVVDSKIIWQTLLLAGADSFLLCHNHPDGGEKFSNADKRTTKQYAKTASIVGIRLLDHVLVGEKSKSYGLFCKSYYIEEGRL